MIKDNGLKSITMSKYLEVMAYTCQVSVRGWVSRGYSVSRERGRPGRVPRERVSLFGSHRVVGFGPVVPAVGQEGWVVVRDHFRGCAVRFGCGGGWGGCGWGEEICGVGSGGVGGGGECAVWLWWVGGWAGGPHCSCNRWCGSRLKNYVMDLTAPAVGVSQCARYWKADAQESYCPGLIQNKARGSVCAKDREKKDAGRKSARKETLLSLF
jgi:hypothetical protein